jgi:ABC-2 type transport system ATP-binding protein
VIEARGLSKRFGDKLAVDRLSFTVHPGRVTGFLGPNGAGKSTTMRMIVGLDAPASGSVSVNGRPYRRLPYPMREVGALLEARAAHGGRSAYQHLLCLAHMNAIPVKRVHEVLALVGLSEVAGKRTKGFSMGVGQRLGVAAALLGDPRVLLFDEPVNGLDPEGIRWIRNLMRKLADEGRTVFVSSHLMSEMSVTADHLVVIGRGRILADTGMKQFIADNTQGYVRVRSPELPLIGAALRGHGWRVEPDAEGGLRVYGAEPAEIGDLAWETGTRLHELATVQPSLEEAFMRLTGDSVEYHAQAPEPSGALS